MPVYSDMTPTLKLTDGGVVALNYDSDVVVQSVRSIFSIVVGERVRNPIGTRILRLLFQRMDNDVARQIRNELVGAITRYEPRVDIISFTLIPDFDNNSYDAKLQLRIKGIQRPETIRTRLRSFASDNI